MHAYRAVLWASGRGSVVSVHEIVDGTILKYLPWSEERRDVVGSTKIQRCVNRPSVFGNELLGRGFAGGRQERHCHNAARGTPRLKCLRQISHLIVREEVAQPHESDSEPSIGPENPLHRKQQG